MKTYSHTHLPRHDSILEVAKHTVALQEYSLKKWPFGNTFEEDQILSRNAALERRRELINDLVDTNSELFSLYLDATDGNVYLEVWGRDCDNVEGTYGRRFKPVYDELTSERRDRQMAKLVDEYIALEKADAEGPCAIRLIHKAEYDRLMSSPPLERDRNLEAFEDGRGTAHVI